MANHPNRSQDPTTYWPTYRVAEPFTAHLHYDLPGLVGYTIAPETQRGFARFMPADKAEHRIARELSRLRSIASGETPMPDYMVADYAPTHRRRAGRQVEMWVAILTALRTADHDAGFRARWDFVAAECATALRRVPRENPMEFTHSTSVYQAGIFIDDLAAGAAHGYGPQSEADRMRATLDAAIDRLWLRRAEIEIERAGLYGTGHRGWQGMDTVTDCGVRHVLGSDRYSAGIVSDIRQRAQSVGLPRAGPRSGPGNE